MLQRALEFARLGWRVLPIASGKNAGSVLGNEWQYQASCDREVITPWFEKTNYDLSVLLGPCSGIIDVEADSPEGSAKANALVGAILTPTFMSSRSTHRIFAWDDQFAQLRKTVYKIDGVEIRIGGNDSEGRPRGCASVFPPSTGRKWVKGRGHIHCEPAMLPQSMINAMLEIDASNMTACSDAPPVEVLRDERVLARASAYVNKMPRAISGQGGHDRTFAAAAKLVRGFALSDDDAYAILTRWNKKCCPPWKEEELRRKTEEAREHGDEEFGAMLDSESDGYEPKVGDFDAGDGRHVVVCPTEELASHLPDRETLVVDDPLSEESCVGLRGINSATLLRVGGDDHKRHAETLRRLCAFTRRLLVADVPPNADESAIREGIERAQPWTPPNKLLPTQAAPRAHFVGEFLRSERCFYTRGRSLQIYKKGGLETIDAKSLPYELSNVGIPDQVTINEAKTLLASRGLHERLPTIRAISPCPMLVDHNGQLVVVAGYDEPSGILASGSPPPEVPLNEAVETLASLLDDFDFVTSSDRTRALAAMISPALIVSGLLGGRAPIDLGEADQSQSGKGWRNKITTAIYGCKAAIVTAKTRAGGVGSLDESFSAAVLAGRSFVNIDNVRGKIDSPMIESYLTEDTAQLRVPYSRPVEVETGRIVIMMTSNKAESTIDLANRSAVVRIRKRPPNYTYRQFPEGDVLAHIAANQPRFLGAVFAIIRAWWDAGRPADDETRHDFRRWAGVMSWITRELMGCDDALLDGHRQAQDRMASLRLSWLRDVAVILGATHNLNRCLRPSQLIRILESHDITIPGCPHGADMLDDSVFRQACQQVGRLMSDVFGEQDSVEIDGWTVRRVTGRDDQSRPINEYRFARIAE